MFHMIIALRYLRGKKKFLFTFSNLLSLLGIVIGVFSLLVVSSVMNGFDSDMRNRIIGSKAEIKVHKTDYSPIKNYSNIIEKIGKEQDVIGAAPICEAELLIQKEDRIASTISYGIVFNKHKTVTNILDKMVIGEPDEMALQDDGIIIGMDLSLVLQATVGEYITISSPIGTEPSPFGLLPRTKKLKVVGIFISSLPEFDKTFSFLSLQNVQYFLNLEDEVNFIEIKTSDAKLSAQTAIKLQKNLSGKYIAEDWSDFESNLFNAMKMEKAIMFIVLALMIVIASFNLTGNFIKLVAEKKIEIGVLKAIGATKKDIIKIFVTMGSIIGMIGTFIGTSLAYLILFLQLKYHLIKIPVSGFPLQWLPVEIRSIDFILVPIIAVFISFLTTLHPAKKTVQIDPIKIITD